MSSSISEKVIGIFKNIMKPSPAAVFAAVKGVKPHVPLIKFRRPPPDMAPASSHRASPGTAQPRTQPQSAPALKGAPSGAGSAIIEDYQLPLRFQKRPIQPDEIAYINRGGPE